MKTNRVLFLVCVGALVCASCRTPSKKPPERSGVPEAIVGRGLMKAGELADFLLSVNTALRRPFAEEFTRLYIEEALAEGINHDVAFSQMCVETGFLRFGGLVTADMYNYCGLGSLGPGQPGERFPSPRIGIRAQMQHLKAYATTEPVKQALVDPRYYWVKRGSAPTIQSLAGSWAADKEYGQKIKAVLERLYATRSTLAFSG